MFRFKLEEHAISFPGLSPYKAVVRQTENGETPVSEIGIPSRLARGTVKYDLCGVGIDKETGDLWAKYYYTIHSGHISERSFKYANISDDPSRARASQPKVEVMETVTNHKGETYQIPACRSKIRFSIIKCECGCGRPNYIDH